MTGYQKKRVKKSEQLVKWSIKTRMNDQRLQSESGKPKAL
jgi:hypothetical protein